MSLPEEGEVIGATSGELVVHRLRTDAPLRLGPGTLRSVAARLSGAREKTPAEHVYLVLEGIRGKQDASALSVYIELPEGSAHGAQAAYFAGTVGLYGLRLASVVKENEPPQGLRFVLDVTPFFRTLHMANAASSDELVVSIRLRRELPETAPVVIERVVMSRKVHGAA
jgi:tyrosinase